MDNRILEKRLLYKESGVGAIPSVNKCAKSFADVLASSTDGSHERAVEALVRDIRAYEFDMRKVSQMIRVCEEELDEMSKENESVEANKRLVQQNVIDLNLQLSQELQLRTLKADCDIVAKKVDSLPSQSILKRQIEAAEKNLQSTLDAVAETNERLAKRLKLVEQIAASVLHLKVDILDEESPLPDATHPEDSDEEGGREDDAAGATTEAYPLGTEEGEDSDNVETEENGNVVDAVPMDVTAADDGAAE
jgi:hypothetical protein